MSEQEHDSVETEETTPEVDPSLEDQYGEPNDGPEVEDDPRLDAEVTDEDTDEAMGLDDHEAAGLLALMLLTEARRPARVSATGELVVLAEQDRSAWDRELIAEGQELVRRCLRRNRPGPYQIQAAIGAVHADAPAAADTDWRQILALYDQLAAVAPGPVVALNRAVALAEVRGPEAGLVEVDRLDLGGHHVWHAIRADLLRRLDRPAQARAAYDAAIAGTGNAAEQTFLRHARDRMPG